MEEEEEEQYPVVQAELSELRLRNEQLMDKLQLNQVLPITHRSYVHVAVLCLYTPSDLYL